MSFGTLAEESLRPIRLRKSDRDSLVLYLDILPGVVRWLLDGVVADVMSGDRAFGEVRRTAASHASTELTYSRPRAREGEGGRSCDDVRARDRETSHRDAEGRAAAGERSIARPQALSRFAGPPGSPFVRPTMSR